MKMQNTVRILAGVALAALLSNRCHSAEETEPAVSMKDVPSAVKTTLKEYAKPEDVKKIEKGDQDGKSVYEFDIEQGTKKFEFTIAPDGKFQGTEEEIQLSDMPEAARKALTDKAAGGKVESAEKALDENKKITYEGVINKDGKKVEVAVDANGKVVSTEEVKPGGGD